MARLFLRRLTVGLSLGVGLLCLFVLGPVGHRDALRAQVVDPCTTTPVNPIACENSKPGNPASEWDIAGSGSAAIQGFATDISVNKGGTIGFKVSTTAGSYRIDIYRLGYYAGNGARLQAQITNPTATNQPACVTDAATGLIDCGNWSQSASWPVPATAVSGIYIAKLVRTDGPSGESHIVFIVRDDSGASPILFQTSDTTWQAYNQYGGNSLYVGSPAGRAYKVSYNRPFTTRGTGPEDWLFNAEYPMVRWLEANGYNVSYFTGVDSDRLGAEIREHRIFLSVGHDEYWSGAQRTNVEAARAAGVNLAFFSGNEVFWKTRWENSIAGGSTAYRTLVSYKETHANAKIDPLPGVWTGTWRDPRFSPPDDGGRPENALTGTIFTVNSGTAAIQVPEPFGKARLWRNTSVASLTAGQTATLSAGTLGYEWDENLDNGARPAGLVSLSSTTVSGVEKLQDYGSTYASGTATHNLTLYRHASGALVFGAGTVQWSWGLDTFHDRTASTADVRMRQATVNLFADMGVQPSTLQSGLVAATASTDTTAPTSTITSPAAGATVTGNSPIDITGTAADVGGIVANVEVSLDNGVTWRPATGRTSWTFSWTTPSTGSLVISVRAVDDSGNVQSPVTTRTVTISGGAGSGGLVASYGFFEGSGTTVTDSSGRNNNGTITAATWNAAGKNGSALTFNGTSAMVSVADSASLDLTTAMTLEAWVRPTTLSNWRTVIMKEMTGGLVYTLYAHNGATPALWARLPGETNLDGTSSLALNTWSHLAATYDGANMRLYVNGVQVASRALASTLPVSTGALRIGGNSIWGEFFAGDIDDVRIYSKALVAAEIVTDMNTPVLPPDSTPPVLVSTSPAAGAVNVPRFSNITATFNEAMMPSSIDSTSFTLRDAQNQVVPAVVTYDPATFTAVFDPVGNLASNGVYTATVRGGAADPRFKDASGNALAASATWSFTVAPQGLICPCTLWEPTDAPLAVDFNDTPSIEVGVKFRSDRNGFITGIRYYKAALNTGTHIGTVWGPTGVALGQALFTNESSTGWQQANFSPAIPVTANTVYTASYFAPNGHYSSDLAALEAGKDSVPLHAPAAGVTPNGVFRYGSPGGYPTQASNAANYWVDVVFVDSVPVDITPPTVTTFAPASGATAVPVTTAVTATFSEGMSAASITSGSFELRQGTTLISATVTYDALNRIAKLQPTVALTPNTVYTATVRGGATDPRVKDAAGNALAATLTWSFTAAAPPANDGNGGPILVVGSIVNPFGRYLSEIVRHEGFNSFTGTDISTVTATMLNSYDVVVLGEMPLTAAQVTMFSDWVNAGGNLIAMRPDKQLASLLGLTDAGAVLSDKYLLVNQSGPGVGIVNQTIQFHGPADLYTLNGATAVANLYSNATTATTNPAVTLRSVGTNGGQVAAFTYDLARSVVYTRQGNPAWAGQERDGQAPIRSDDMFFGGTEADWVDFNKIAIPQADEQQRLLANLIVSMNGDRKALLRFWYLPRMLKGAVIMTGDDHNTTNGTVARFNNYTAVSPAGCNVANWECIRATSYVFTAAAITNAQAVTFNNAGFEVAAHMNTNCTDYTAASLASDFNTQLTQFTAKFTGIPAPTTNRTHCIVWSDWASQPIWDRTKNIRLDTSYYYWPGGWILDRPGLFTGSGLPMRFANTDGTTIDVFQATTQITDESSQTYQLHIDALLDKAIGAEGYYTVVTANMHTDYASHPGSDAIVASAVARGIPVISAKQMLTWLDGRNNSTFSALTRSGNTETFTITAATGSTGLYALLPTQSLGGSLSTLTRAGTAVTFTRQTIKGVEYAVFAATAGAYTATYAAPPDTTITSSPAATTTSTSASFSFTANPAAGATFECALDTAAFAACTTPRAYTGLAAGSHTFQVRAVNAQGSDPTPASFSWLITTGPPDTTLTATPPATTTSTSASFSFTANPAAGATFQCSLDGAAYTTCTSPQAYTGLAVSSHTFNVRAVNAGGTDATPATFTWTISVLAVPDTTITANPPASTAATTAAFQFTSTPGGATFECSLDGAPFTPCTSPQNYSAIAPGNHAFSVRATNAAGTDPTPATYNWTVTGTACPCSLWPAATVPGNLAAADAGPLEIGVKFQSERAGLITAIRFYKDASNTGAHVGHLWSAAGTLLATATFTGETASGWQQAPLDNAVSVTANTTYIASYYAPVGRYSYDSGYFNSTRTNSPLSAPDTASSGGNGVYRYGTGTLFPDQTFGAANYWVDLVFVDSLAPPTVTSTTPVNGATSVPQTTAVTAVFSKDLNAATVTTTTFELRDAAAALIPSTVSYNAATRTATLQPNAALPVGTYTARLIGGASGTRIMDTTGNALASTVAVTFTTAAPPDTAITGTPTATTTSTSATFTFTATPATGATFQCSLDGAAYATCTTPLTYSALALGGHTFNVRAVNAAGTDATPASFTWTINAPVPDTTITGTPGASTTSTSATFTFTSTPAGATFECSLDSGAFTACASGVTYTSLTVAAHTFSVRAVNTAGPDPTPATFAWTINPLVVPDTTITSSPTATTTSTSATFTFTSTPAGATFECSLDGAAFAACVTPVTYSSLAVSGHTFSVRAVNGAGPDPTPATFAWTITLPLPDTTITSSPAASTTATTAAFTFTATPATGATFECSLDGAAYAACTTPANYTALALGSHTFGVRAVNATGTDGTPATFAWTITSATANLVLALGFEEGTGTTAADLSGSGNNGTLSNATWATTGRFGRAVSFNGTNAMVTVADSNSLDLTTGMTLEAWVNPTTATNWRTVILKERPSALAYSLYGSNGSAATSWINIGGNDRHADGATILPLNTWTHLAATYDGATLRLYVNGAQVGSLATTGAMNTSTNPLRIGGNAIWGEWFSGMIDEVRIYNRALTAAEITTDMNTAIRP